MRYQRIKAKDVREGDLLIFPDIPGGLEVVQHGRSGRDVVIYLANSTVLDVGANDLLAVAR